VLPRADIERRNPGEKKKKRKRLNPKVQERKTQQANFFQGGRFGSTSRLLGTKNFNLGGHAKGGEKVWKKAIKRKANRESLRPGKRHLKNNASEEAGNDRGGGIWLNFWKGETEEDRTVPITILT